VALSARGARRRRRRRGEVDSLAIVDLRRRNKSQDCLSVWCASSIFIKP
jgi:hypothetical protein